MKEWLKKNEQSWPIVMLIALIVLAFYWYSWRPHQIRKTCANDATLRGFMTLGRSDNFNEAPYNQCLRQNGL